MSRDTSDNGSIYLGIGVFLFMSALIIVGVALPSAELLAGGIAGDVVGLLIGIGNVLRDDR